MTPSKEEITALEEAVRYVGKAAQAYLDLITGKHETLVVVPREPTEKMSDKGEYVNSEWLNDNAPLGQVSYRNPAKAVYKAMIQAVQEGPHEN